MLSSLSIHNAALQRLSPTARDGHLTLTSKSYSGSNGYSLAQKQGEANKIVRQRVLRQELVRQASAYDSQRPLLQCWFMQTNSNDSHAVEADALRRLI
jgi:hypothetical protein